jgi:hypothetical protein
MASKKDISKRNEKMRKLPKSNPTVKKNMASSSSSSKKQSLVQDITNRYRVTAREARDIVTAVGTLGRTVVDSNIAPDYKSKTGLSGSSTNTGKSSRRAITEAAGRNLVKQVRETAGSALKGKKGSTSASVETDFRDQFGNPRGGMYKAAKKRK